MKDPLLYDTISCGYSSTRRAAPRIAGKHVAGASRCLSLPVLGSICAIMAFMRTVGLRELRQEASDLVRQVQSGEEIEITVSGRPAARMIPAAPKRWQRWSDIAGLFNGRSDPDWQRDVDFVDQDAANPWERSH